MATTTTTIDETRLGGGTVLTPLGVDMARIEEFYLSELEAERRRYRPGGYCGREVSAGLTTIGLTVLSFVPAALVLVPLFWIFFGLGLPESKVGSACYGLFLLQPLGAAGAVGFKRWRESLLPIGSTRLVDSFSLPFAFYSAPIPIVTSGLCWILNGCKHSADSSPAIFYLISGRDGFLTSRQMWVLRLLESCFIASCLVALSGLFCIMLAFDPNEHPMVFIFSLAPFGWYYLIRRLLVSPGFSVCDVLYQPAPTADENEFEIA